VNVPDKKEIEVADVAKGSVLARWATTAATTCFPMALDEAHHRLFAGCRTPARLLVYDTETGKTVASPEVVDDTDDFFYDAQRSRVYVIGGQGFIDALQQKDPDHYERIARYPTPPVPEPAFRARMGKTLRRYTAPKRAALRDPRVRGKMRRKRDRSIYQSSPYRLPLPCFRPAKKG